MCIPANHYVIAGCAEHLGVLRQIKRGAGYVYYQSEHTSISRGYFMSSFIYFLIIEFINFHHHHSTISSPFFAINFLRNIDIFKRTMNE